MRRHEVLLVLAFTALSIGTRRPGPLDLPAIATGLLLVAATLTSMGRDRLDPVWASDRGAMRLLLCLALLLILVGFFDPRLVRTLSGPRTKKLELALQALWLLTLAGTYLVYRVRRGAKPATVAAAIVAIAALGSIAIVVATPKPPIDVWHLHAESARALVSGENPYTDAVSVVETTPEAPPGSLIVGNVYPPLTAVCYALGHSLVADGRATSIAAWLVILVTIASIVLRLPMEERFPGILLVLLFAVHHGWPYVLEHAWTEPLSLAFIALAIRFWHRPILGGVMLGLAFASKQYFLVAAPFLLLPRDPLSPRRALAAVVVVVATLTPFVILDAHSLYEATIAFHFHVLPRPDASNIVGLLASFGFLWKPPLVVTIGLALAVAFWLRPRIRDGADFAIALATVLGVSFMTGGHAFANYWFLVSGLVLLGVVARRASQGQRIT